jgi:hypothetical protein
MRDKTGQGYAPIIIHIIMEHFSTCERTGRRNHDLQDLDRLQLKLPTNQSRTLNTIPGCKTALNSANLVNGNPIHSSNSTKPLTRKSPHLTLQDIHRRNKTQPDQNLNPKTKKSTQNKLPVQKQFFFYQKT